jgi:diguanylate cyclase (GGDEF)-like protein
MTISSFLLAISGNWDLTLVALPTSAALAAVALIGYIFGQRTRKAATVELDGRRQRELERAARIAWQLETIAGRLRQDLVSHHSQVETFKRRLTQAKSEGGEETWKKVCEEAEAILGPTMQLAHQLSRAYDDIRQQSDALETFTEGRTDPLTGVGNGRALEGQLQVLLTSVAGGPAEFVVAIVSLDRTGNSSQSSRAAADASLLPKMAGVIRACMRDTDFVARFGNDEFVIVMPQTSPAGACVFGDRLRERIAAELNMTLCCGIAESIAADDSKSLLARADSALYSAKATGTNRMFVHTGAQIREHRANSAAAAKKSGSRAAGPRAGAPAEASPANSDAELDIELVSAVSVGDRSEA